MLGAGIGTGHAVVGATASALQGVAAVDHALAGDREVTQSVVLLLHASVGHGSHSKGYEIRDKSFSGVSVKPVR